MPAGRGSLLERDAGLLWHPYAPLRENGASSALAEVRGAAGAQLLLRDGDGAERWAVDGMASWWSAVHGYRNPVLDQAAHAQIDSFSHVMFGGLTHEPAVVLAERLRELSPATPHVFLADSGSVSVEVALKLAVQHEAARGRPRRRRFLALRGGYHGDTTGAMSVTDPEGGMHREFAGLLPEHVFLPRPPERSAPAEEVEAWADAARETARAHRDELAAVVCEPLVQGAGGMRFYAPECLRALREICDELEILLIADEIATGFWRTGTLFACEAAGVTPDVRCVGKALTGGYATLAAVLVGEAPARVIGDSPLRALMHGPTFMGNPLACAIASASLGLLDGPDPASAAVRRIERALESGLGPCRELDGVADVRVLGAIGVVQAERPVDAAAVTRLCLERGAGVRPFRDLVYVMPPYVASDDELATLCSAVRAAADEQLGGQASEGERP
ncbi:adenosylmethionine--8-amino-7-oxononanoate transaminase [Arthrobacter sp. UM1]|uniref:adenosylmethionine--8-amino-7-oxononanoate transaminase n=1 Tax=Arthrobacter sp. UM1 TaxID=2766776 RepID=UPI001CF6F398|nr:adenosylmethionine--8-amino-7-oxononanoate transaminase [Arthrobacter sp. UM1]MCB4208744.1 adenosylmethionine--8-amino-7-oxononanoate transaminase [Arthrobacter sp. UM1]